MQRRIVTAIFVFVLYSVLPGADSLTNSTSTNVEQKGVSEDQKPSEFLRTFLEPRRSERSVDVGRFLVASAMSVRIYLLTMPAEAPCQNPWLARMAPQVLLIPRLSSSSDFSSSSLARSSLAISTVRRPVLHTLSEQAAWQRCEASDGAPAAQSLIGTSCCCLVWSTGMRRIPGAGLTPAA
eukprot:761001-Hanusia_phi.AAC.1